MKEKFNWKRFYTRLIPIVATGCFIVDRAIASFNNYNLKPKQQIALIIRENPKQGLEGEVATQEVATQKATTQEIKAQTIEQIAGTQSTELKQNPNDEYLYQTLARHEGKRNWVYDDKTGERLYPGDSAEGNRTIGVGFNLEKKGAKLSIKELGLDYEKVINGKHCLTEEQINSLFQKDLEIAKSDARKYIGKSFEKLPEQAKNLVINMAFNMGYNRLSGFENFKKALINKDYNSAAKEIINSGWYNQTGYRAEEIVSEMKELAKKKP